MELSWWEQVGPRQFFTGVLQSLKSTSVVVWFPAHTAESIMTPLADYVPLLADELVFIDAGEGGSPEQQVGEELEKAGENELLPARLARVRLMVAVRNVRRETWPEWRQLLNAYHRYLEGEKLLAAGATRFLIVARATENDASRTSVAVKHLRYDGWVSLSDTERYCDRLLAGDVRPAIEREVLAAVIARLALWDKGIADVLCTKTLADVLSPEKALKPLATDRKWRQHTAASWESGCSNRVDGKECLNSVFLYASGQMEEIENRIWRALLKVLFPYIEEQRNRFIKLVRDLKFIAAETDFDEMEFKAIRRHLLDHIPRNKADEFSIYLDIAFAFGVVRNDLAHRRVASAETLNAMFRAAAAMDELDRNGRMAGRESAVAY
jgi:hypothetical protein